MSDMTTEEAFDALCNYSVGKVSRGDAKVAIDILRNRLAGQLEALKAIHKECTTGEDARNIVLFCADIAAKFLNELEAKVCVEVPNSGDYIYNSSEECIKTEAHCSEVDDDGYCNLCGDSPE